MSRVKYFAVLILWQLIGFAHAIEYQPTEIVVRAKAKDGKFIGSSVGGAMIRIKDAESGEILASGLTKGSTGNTELIMKQNHSRYTSITKDAAAFKTALHISKPIFLTIEVVSPYIKKQARVLSQTQTWLVPEKHINGDGLIVEVPGMIVDVLSPGTHLYSSVKNSPFEIKANVVMMCGCIITKNGLWDGNNIEVAAIVNKDDEFLQTIPLEMQDEMNTFKSSLQAKGPGKYQITVYAYDPKTGNTGVDQMSFVVTE